MIFWWPPVFSADADYPAVTDVREGVAYGAGTGTLDLADAGDLREGVTQDNGNIVGTLAQTVTDGVNISAAGSSVTISGE